MKTRSFAIACALATLVLTGCGQGDDAQSTTAGVNASGVTIVGITRVTSQNLIKFQDVAKSGWYDSAYDVSGKYTLKTTTGEVVQFTGLSCTDAAADGYTVESCTATSGRFAAKFRVKLEGAIPTLLKLDELTIDGETGVNDDPVIICTGGGNCNGF